MNAFLRVWHIFWQSLRNMYYSATRITLCVFIYCCT